MTRDGASSVRSDCPSRAGFDGRLPASKHQYDGVGAGLAVDGDGRVFGRVVEFHRGFSIRKLQHDDLVALERSFQHHRLLVGYQEPAFELAKHLEEARLVSVIKFATGEFELGDRYTRSYL